MAEVDAQLPLSAVRGIDEVRSEALARQRVLMMLVAALGATALLLAAIGIHALIASARHRTHARARHPDRAWRQRRTNHPGCRLARHCALAGRPGDWLRCGVRRLGTDSQPAVGRTRKRSVNVCGGGGAVAHGRARRKRHSRSLREKTRSSDVASRGIARHQAPGTGHQDSLMPGA